MEGGGAEGQKGNPLAVELGNVAEMLPTERGPMEVVAFLEESDADAGQQIRLSGNRRAKVQLFLIPTARTNDFIIPDEAAQGILGLFRRLCERGPGRTFHFPTRSIRQNSQAPTVIKRKFGTHSRKWGWSRVRVSKACPRTTKL